MIKFGFEHTIKYKKILEIKEKEIDLSDENGINSFITKECVYDSNLYEGEEVVVLSYKWSTPEGYISFDLDGIMNKSRYDNAVRDSQKLPKGWIREPSFEVSEDIGTIKAFTDSIGAREKLFQSYNNPNVKYSFEEVLGLNKMVDGEDIVILTYTLNYPNGQTKSMKEAFTLPYYERICTDPYKRNKL